MIFSIAWKNIWRNKLRSMVILIAIALGIMSGVFSVGVMKGVVLQRIDAALNNETSSIQIHNANFAENNEIGMLIDSTSQIIADLTSSLEVKSVSQRIKTEVMFTSSRAVGGGYLVGINPVEEIKTTKIYTMLLDSGGGSYFDKPASYPIVISKKMAENLKVKLRNKIEINGIDKNGFSIKQVFKIVGIYKTSNSMFDGMHAYAKIDDLRNIFGINENQSHEIAILLKKAEETDSFTYKLQQKYQLYSFDSTSLVKIINDSISTSCYNSLKQILSNNVYHHYGFQNILKSTLSETDFDIYGNLIMEKSLKGLHVEDWKKIAPDLGITTVYMDFMLFIFIGIILLAMGFGIINTMLMVVLERTRELGMLISVGMNKSRVYRMIMIETVLLTLTGAVIGMFISWILILLTQQSGIDLSIFGEGFESIGYSPIIYPVVQLIDYIETTILVIITGILSSVYPAWKAIKLKPAEAVRSE